MRVAQTGKASVQHKMIDGLKVFVNFMKFNGHHAILGLVKRGPDHPYSADADLFEKFILSELGTRE